VGAVIVFPWMFTVWMSAFDWKIGTEAHFVGLENYVKLFTNRRCRMSAALRRIAAFGSKFGSMARPT